MWHYYPASEKQNLWDVQVQVEDKLKMKYKDIGGNSLKKNPHPLWSLLGSMLEEIL